MLTTPCPHCHKPMTRSEPPPPELSGWQGVPDCCGRADCHRKMLRAYPGDRHQVERRIRELPEKLQTRVGNWRNRGLFQDIAKTLHGTNLRYNIGGGHILKTADELKDILTVK